MPLNRIVIAVVLIFMSLIAVPASAQAVIPCGQRADIIQKLNEKYSESPVSIGLTNAGSVLEIFASKDRTFSVIVTQPNGIACLIATGGNWENLNAALAGFKI